MIAIGLGLILSCFTAGVAGAAAVAASIAYRTRRLEDEREMLWVEVAYLHGRDHELRSIVEELAPGRLQDYAPGNEPPTDV